jgi:cell fate regulator YaaT (PSP1 superfamily)
MSNVILTCELAPWDKPIQIDKTVGGKSIKNKEFKVGDFVIIKTDQGTDLAKITKIEESKGESKETTKGFNILVRKAKEEDLEKMKKKEQGKEEALKICNELIKKHNLPMKLVDVLFHFDGGRITFAFTAPTKVDFRELVKDLTQAFHKSIRLYQISVRQETELKGDIGPCGKILCCRSFLQKLGNVTIETIFDQQIVHRGIDRLTGVCGRLKCCLLYEEEMYKELAKKLPPIGSLVKTAQGEGKVIDWKILKQTVIIEIENGIIIEASVDQLLK